MKTPKKPIFLGTDHAGFKLKEAIKAYLTRLGFEVRDFGTDSEESCDYPDFIIPTVMAAIRARGRAIVFGMTGIGECIAANKVIGARAALVYDSFTARLTREHNDSNVLCLGGRTVTGDIRLAKRLVKIWLDTPFSGEARHVRRLKKISRFELTPRGKNSR
jgi:ribose 5-phosphate isomerase B